jgi:hypothetical protein
MMGINIINDSLDNVTITFHDNPALVEKVRTLDDRIWHSNERNRTVPFSERTVKKI